jgi:GT2 family glycosyltransferase
LNQDTILEPDYLANLVAFSDKHPAVGSVAGKIKRLTDGQKTNKIDSLGLKMWRSGQVTDLGETQEDRDINSAPHEVFGVSGVIPLYRRAALEATAHLNRPGKNEYLDETFFAYKEDIDLAFRLRLQGWTSYCVPAAVAFHSRSVRDEGAVERGNLAIARRRQNMSRFRRKLSFANHHFLYFKNLPCQVWWRNLPPMLWYETKMWGYALLREPFLIPDMGRVFSRFPEMMRKRYAIMNQRKISSFDLQRWFS